MKTITKLELGQIALFGVGLFLTSISGVVIAISKSLIAFMLLTFIGGSLVLSAMFLAEYVGKLKAQEEKNK